MKTKCTTLVHPECEKKKHSLKCNLQAKYFIQRICLLVLAGQRPGLTLQPVQINPQQQQQLAQLHFQVNFPVLPHPAVQCMNNFVTFKVCVKI